MYFCRPAHVLCTTTRQTHGFNICVCGVRLLQAVSSIPQATLQALLPVLSGIDPAKLTAQMKLLGQQDKETLDKMIFFLKAVSTLSLS